jgi:hypothetical protein
MKKLHTYVVRLDSLCLLGFIPLGTGADELSLSSPLFDNGGMLPADLKCTRGDAVHAYTMTLYALNAHPEVLGNQDDADVDSGTVIEAIGDKIIASSRLDFSN